MTTQSIATKQTGRPCLLTPQLQEDICKLIAAGNYLTTACASVGISPETFRGWNERGETERDAGDTSGKFSGFIVAVKRAEADREAIMAQRVIDAAMPGVRKTVTKPVLVQGLPVFDDNGDIKTVDEVTHTGGDWLAAMTFLERRYPERWARPAPTNQGGGGNTYNINIDKAIIDAAGKFDAIIDRLAARTGAPVAIPSPETAPDVEPGKYTAPGDTEPGTTPDTGGTPDTATAPEPDTPAGSTLVTMYGDEVRH